MTRTRGGLAALAVLGLAATAGLSGCGNDAEAGDGVTLSLVSYSTPQAAFEEIIEAFQATEPGKNVEFKQSYGASGDQSRAVEAGLPADIVEFSLAPDMERLVEAGIVAEDWDQNRHDGMVTDSVVVIATREGNPKNLTDWPDLIQEGVEVITPNPSTSGGARWNIMAAYGGARAAGASDQEAQEYLADLLANVPVQDDSARKSLQTFTGGKGDAILAYENEVIFANDNGQKLEYTTPDATILIENPVAVTENSQHPTEAEAFYDFLYTEEAQRIFSENGYRPVVESAATREFPEPSRLFDITEFGGWGEVAAKFFDAEDGVVTKINQGLGVQTTK